VCQRCKHPNRLFTVEERHHLPEKPGDVCAIVVYGSLPTSRGSVCYILVCHDTFSRFIKLYPLRSVTNKACLDKLINHILVMLLSPNAFFPTMPRNLGRRLGVDNCSNRELKSGLLLFDFRSQTPANGICVNCPNSAGYTAMRITGSGLSYYRI
jgi:hypothetical protein